MTKETKSWIKPKPNIKDTSMNLVTKLSAPHLKGVDISREIGLPRSLSEVTNSVHEYSSREPPE